jgi:hypothetical protein
MAAMGFTDDELDPVSFPQGSGVMIELEDGGLEAGDLQGANGYGVVVRITHRLKTTRISDPEERQAILDAAGIDLEDVDEANLSETRLVPLARPILTLLPWPRIERVELASDLMEEAEVRGFQLQLDELDQDPGLDLESPGESLSPGEGDGLGTDEEERDPE